MEFGYCRDMGNKMQTTRRLRVQGEEGHGKNIDTACTVSGSLTGFGNRLLISDEVRNKRMPLKSLDSLASLKFKQNPPSMLCCSWYSRTAILLIMLSIRWSGLQINALSIRQAGRGPRILASCCYLRPLDSHVFPWCLGLQKKGSPYSQVSTHPLEFPSPSPLNRKS